MGFSAEEVRLMIVGAIVAIVALVALIRRQSRPKNVSRRPEVIAPIPQPTTATYSKPEVTISADGRKGYLYQGADGRQRWQSEESRNASIRAEREIKEREERRKAKGIDVSARGRNADLLLELIEKHYTFGDPTFRPDPIYAMGADTYGFEWWYTKELVDLLCNNGKVKRVYKPLKREDYMDPRDWITDAGAYWHLLRVDKTNIQADHENTGNQNWGDRAPD